MQEHKHRKQVLHVQPAGRVPTSRINCESGQKKKFIKLVIYYKLRYIKTDIYAHISSNKSFF